MTALLRPSTLAEAVACLAQPGARVLAGGTDLYPAVTGADLPGRLVDVAGLAELRGISAAEGGLRIGACTTWAEVARADLPPALDMLRAAAREVGGRQIQNAGTVGGNLCNASPAADGVPPLLACGALVELVSAAGVRRLPLAEFLTGPRRTALGPGEMLAAVAIPAEGLAGRSAFLKLGARRHLVISIVMVAVRLVVVQGRIAEAAVAVGACSPVARRLPGVEAGLVGLAPADVRVDPAALAPLSPIDDPRATAAYRLTAAAELIRRAVAEAAR